MSVFGMGAMYGGNENQLEKFLSLGVACVGYSIEEAPSIHAQMKSLKFGDIIFIKSYAPTAGLHIKAVGIVTNPNFRQITEQVGWGVNVRWKSLPEKTIDLGKIEDHADFMRRGSLYEEFNPSVIQQVIDLLLPPSK